MSKDIVSIRSLVPPYFQHHIASPFSDRFLIRKLEKEIIRKRSVHLYTRCCTLVDSSSSENKQNTRTSPTSTIKIYFIKCSFNCMFVAIPRSNSFCLLRKAVYVPLFPFCRKRSTNVSRTFCRLLTYVLRKFSRIFTDYRDSKPQKSANAILLMSLVSSYVRTYVVIGMGNVGAVGDDAPTSLFKRRKVPSSEVHQIFV